MRESERKRLTTDRRKIFARESLTIMSMTKDELRQHYNEIFDRLQEYEVAEETGQIIVPPCKVGDVVYKPWKAGGRSVVADFVVVAIISAIRDVWCIKYKKVGGTICYQAVISDIGKTVFTSREDAEKALKGDEGK